LGCGPSSLEGVLGCPLKKLGKMEYLVILSHFLAKTKVADRFSADKIGDETM